MPQINQLGDVALSQLFWLLLTLAILYFGIARSMVPKIHSTIEAREQCIAADLEAAQRAREEADATEEAYRARMNEGRLQAMRLSQEAKQQGSRATEQRVSEADAVNRRQIEAAEEGIRAASQAALGEVESVAAQAARDIVARLAGIDVPADEAARAVKEAAHV